MTSGKSDRLVPSLKPVTTYVLADTSPGDVGRTGSGIVLPSNTLDQPSFARVRAAGPDVKNVTVGDLIVHKTTGVVNVWVDGQQYLLFKEDQIMATMSDTGFDADI